MAQGNTREPLVSKKFQGHKFTVNQSRVSGFVFRCHKFTGGKKEVKSKVSGLVPVWKKMKIRRANVPVRKISFETTME